ncbi:Ig-like domain-containing protein [Polaribacter ponticola]|uniref:Ig-like domain-containing protein n=1 Tax=Polaribacter ponticola TaxID=2978475 RepID=A0ABT5SCH0_9FLAO|nr:Ig-like domain-containing protein [Polaribacter sp. MSW5]MDD7915816.1 Ig-like domain-containing protein [Polaribacter sp. MSW5]
MRIVSKFLFLVVLVFFASNCARTGTPEGGPKDEEAPLFVTANPAYESIKFDKKEIKIDFNEYIVLKDLSKQLVVSPPMKNPPLISPQGSPSKFIKIEILDTLKLNTTYIFNFGNAVQDNNEGNKLENFKYVFSTGDYIDSLTAKGIVKDARSLKNPKDVSVLLYRIDSAFNDSIIYKEKPSYITNNIDSVGFNFTNLRKGKYLMLALKESVSDYIFNPKTDKIGYVTDTIQLPKDSIIKKSIILFKEEQPYLFKRGKEVTKGKIEFGFEGDAKNMQINMLSEVPKDFKSISKFEKTKDTLNFWFTPIEADSLNFIVSNNNFIDTVTVKLRKKKLDSLIMNSSIKNTLHFRDTFFLTSNNPIIKIDTSKVSLFDKDTVAVNYKTFRSKKENKIGIIFNKKPKDKYRFKAFPNAFNDIYGITNDTLNYNFRTKEIEDYGRITLKVNNVNSKNLIIELLTGKDQLVIERKFINTSKTIIFDLLEPKNYTIRAIIDKNKNNKWDTGNFLKKQLAETIIYHDGIKDAELRANYFLEEIFTID